MIVNSKNIQIFCDIVKKYNTGLISECLPIKVTNEHIIIKFTRITNEDSTANTEEYKQNLDRLRYGVKAILMDFDRSVKRVVEVLI